MFASPGGRKAARDGRPGRKLTFDYVSFMVVFLVLPVALFLVFVIWPFAQAIYYALTRLVGVLGRLQLHRSRQLP